MALEEIQAEIGGKWKLDRSENFDDFLKELGLNVVFRKMASTARPTIEFQVGENEVRLVSKVSFFNQVMVIKLDQEYQQSFERLEMNCRSRWENKTLITEATPVSEGKGKPQKFTRQVINGELVQKMYVGKVECIRVFTRISSPE